MGVIGTTGATAKYFTPLQTIDVCVSQNLRVLPTNVRVSMVRLQQGQSVLRMVLQNARVVMMVITLK